MSLFFLILVKFFQNLLMIEIFLNKKSRIMDVSVATYSQEVFRWLIKQPVT